MQRSQKRVCYSLPSLSCGFDFGFAASERERRVRMEEHKAKIKKEQGRSRHMRIFISLPFDR